MINLSNRKIKFIVGIAIVEFIAIVFLLFKIQPFPKNYILSLNQQLELSNAELIEKNDISDKLDLVQVRDFMRYNCKNRIRIGGHAPYVQNAPDKLWRIDGAWFACLDGRLDFDKQNCLVFSFGINHDYSFDKEMVDKYSCYVHSFDPFVEANIFETYRKSNPALENSTVLDVKDKWTFYRLGISHIKPKSLDALKIGDTLDFKSILKLTKSENKVMDILKMDVEGPEKQFIQSLDMNYACKYVKQFVLETHANFKFKDMVKLEECFYLYHRETRFFIGDSYDDRTGHLTEFQNPKGYALNLKKFGNELNLAEFMFTSGEMYFVNKNFL